MMFARKGKMNWKKPLNVLLVSALTVGLWTSALAPQTVKAATAVAPGGVSTNPVLWLKADDGVAANGGTLTGWTDKTGTNNFTVTGTPGYKTNGVNFNPAVTFTGNSGNKESGALHKLIGDKEITYADAYVVFNKPGGVVVGSSTGGGNYGPGIFSREGNVLYAAGNGNNGIYTTFDFNNKNAQPRMVNADIGGSEHKARLDGLDQTLTKKVAFSPISIKPVIASTISKGNSQNYYNFNGEIAEVILYSGSTASDRTKIETYLAVKYGITLGNGETNYIATDDSTVWTADSTYKNNIAGIGQDNNEGLIQKQSRSINTGTQVAIGVGSLAETNAANTSTLANGQYLIWGDNGKELTFSKQIGTTNKNHAERIWKVQNTGAVGEAQIAIPMSTIPADATLLVSSSDTDFTNATEYDLTSTTFEGVSYFTTKAPLANGQYFTFAAPAPVLESAAIKQTQTNGNQLTLTFDQDVALTDLSGFGVNVDGTPINGVTFTVDSTDPKKLILTLPAGTNVTGKTVNVSYDGTGTLKGKNGVPVNSFTKNAGDPFTAALIITKPATGDKVNVPRPEMKGNAEAGSSVTVAVYGEDGEPIAGASGLATWGSDGQWSFTPPVDLPDGKYKIQVTATKDGNIATKEQMFEVATLQITEPAGGTVTVAKPEFKGRATPGSTVTVKIADGITGTVTADANGNWSYTPADDLADGNYTVEVTATKDGKSSTVSKGLKVDTADQSTLTGLQLNSWNGTSIGLSPNFNGSSTKYTASVTNSVYSVTLLPTALDPNSKIEVSVNNSVYQVIPNGAASDNLPINVGTNTIVVKVTDSKGKVTEYTLIVTRADNGTTTPPTGPSGPISPPDDSGIDTSVNGKKSTFATGKTSTSGDRNITSVQVDLDKLAEELAKGDGQKLGIHSSKDSDVQVDGLTAATVKQLSDKGASLEISNPLAIYPVPGGKMDLNGVSKQLGNAALGDIAVHIDIKRSSEALINSAKSKATAEGYELLVDPVDLDLTFSHDGKTVRSEQLNGYAAKYIALPEGIDPNRITTGVIVNPDGSVFHVPTVVTKINNRYYAMINDLRSQGSYSVIWNPQDFDDVKKHWGKADVNNIAARLDLAGTGNNTFSPNRNVTRSEFSEIVVMGLGLMRQNAPQNIFPDVSGSAWYRDAVAIANEFDIVRGYSDGNFYGDRQITREQGFAMIARAYNLIKPKAALGQEKIDSLLAAYEDAANISAWAKADVAQLIEAGIVQGNGPLLLSPQVNMTRAEVTALIARLLKVTELIDK